MVLKACETCNAMTNCHGKQRFCPPCGEVHKKNRVKEKNARHNALAREAKTSRKCTDCDRIVGARKFLCDSCRLNREEKNYSKKLDRLNQKRIVNRCDKSCEECGKKGVFKIKINRFCKDCADARCQKYRIEYAILNRDKLYARKRMWYQINRTEVRKRAKIYAEKTRPRILQHKRRMYQVNIERRRTESRDYYGRMTQEMKNKTRIKRNDWRRTKMIHDIKFALRHRLAGRIRAALLANGVSKNTSTIMLLGCSVQHARKHIQSTFKHGMTWENYGKWQIDHVWPCAMFDLTQIAEQYKCFHYSNLQALWRDENLLKSDQIDEETITLTSIYLLFEECSVQCMRGGA